MLVKDLSGADLAERMRADGIALDFGLARARIRSDVAPLAAALRDAYAEFPLEPLAEFADVAARLERAGGFRRFVRPQIRFFADGEYPFEPFPADTHLPMLEWGLNWCIARRLNQHLLLHAGVVARGDRAVILPALPGSGKSTLTAALACGGFRLLSDEFAVVRLDDGRILPSVRPVALKNDSVAALRAFPGPARIGRVFPKTRKGDVAYFAPDAASVAARRTAATPALVAFPEFTPGAAPAFEPFPRARAFAKVAVNAFNYELLGPPAFRAVGRLIGAVPCFRFKYSALGPAVAALGDLLEGLAEKPQSSRAA